MSLVLCLAAVFLGAPATGMAGSQFKRLFTTNVGVSSNYGMARSADGRLHLSFVWLDKGHPSGVGAMAISPAGFPGPVVQALAGWDAGKTGLVALPGGQLESFFGGTSPDNVSSVFEITSTTGGTTWSAPADVRNTGGMEALAYGSDVTAALTGGSTEVLALPQAGNIVIQQGLGPNSTAYQATDTSDNATTDVDLAVDAATGAVVGGWQSLAGPGHDLLAQLAPALGAVNVVQGQLRPALRVAGRDKGPGVFATYSADGSHVRLARYGGGSLAVGSAKGVAAKVLGVATGLGGRIWAIWGDDTNVALTRSNKAVTRFEPIQQLKVDAASLFRLGGDGRRGPLDLLADAIPNGNPIPPAGVFYKRVLPILSATASIKKSTLKVTVNDAGDPVGGATVAAGGQKTKTNSKGVATLTLKKPAKSSVTITASGYQALKISF